MKRVNWHQYTNKAHLQELCDEVRDETEDMTYAVAYGFGKCQLIHGEMPLSPAGMPRSQIAAFMQGYIEGFRCGRAMWYTWFCSF